MISLYDTARQQVVPLEQRDPGRVSIYVCGPTVYAPPHIGHGRMALVYDILRRYLIWTGLEVTFVSNITDMSGLFGPIHFENCPSTERYF